MDHKIIISFLYWTIWFLNVLAYFPTIKDIFINRKKRANFNSYLVWLFISLITFLYAFFVVNDFLFILMSWISIFLNIIVLIWYFRIIFIKRCNHKIKKCKKKFKL